MRSKPALQSKCLRICFRGCLADFVDGRFQEEDSRIRRQVQVDVHMWDT